MWFPGTPGRNRGRTGRELEVEGATSKGDGMEGKEERGNEKEKNPLKSK